jgi:uncharacterized protein YfaS (alpha-2-macroglobulin family)
MTKRRVALTLHSLLLIAAILTSCAGTPVVNISSTSTPVIPTPTAFTQALPPALVETDPPLGSVIGHQSPITFFFNQPVNKASAETALTGLPAGTFTWNDDATLKFTPTQPYPANTPLAFSIANSLQSENGFGLTEPIGLSFTVADYLRATNLLPQPGAENVDVDAAIVASFNQPVVVLGGDAASQPAAFEIQPPIQGRGEWINTSTYIFYPEPAMAGGTVYTVSLDMNLKTASGVGWSGAERIVWTFTTSRPNVVSLEPSIMELLPLDPEITLTFNQPMNTESVETNFSFRGTEGALAGEFSWNEDETEMTFIPEDLLERNVGYTVHLGAAASSTGGMVLGADYGAVYTTYDNFVVSNTKTDFGTTTFTFSSPLASAKYDNLISVFPDVDNLQTQVSENGLELYVYGDFAPDTTYTFDLSALIRDRWGQSLGDAFIVESHTPPLPPMLNVPLFGWPMAFVRPDEPVLYANAVNLQSVNTTVAPLTLQEFFSLQNSYDNQQAYIPNNPSALFQTFELAPGRSNDVPIGLVQPNTQLLPGLYYAQLSSPQIESRNIYLIASSQVNLTFKHGATEALVWAVDLPSQTPVANAPVTIYDDAGNTIGSGTTDEDGLWKGAISEYEGLAYAMLGAPGDENFALSVSGWSWGLSAWNFGYSQRVQKPHTKVYMYTDRPIYRPGQKVYFRGVVRQAFNGRYELPQVSTIPFTLRDANGVQLASYDIPLSPYGTFSGEFTLSEEAVPGYYVFDNASLEFYLAFQVAEYRKPEINLNAGFTKEEIKLGDSPEASINAQYFFDAPAGNVSVNWALYTKPDFFQLPGYETGLLNTSWMNVSGFGEFGPDYLGELIESGTSQTTSQGTLSLGLPAIPERESGQIVTLEVSAQDESGLPVSARTEMHVHPADFYIGLKPDQWVGRADAPIGFEVYTVDWDQNPVGNKELNAVFQNVRWERETDQHGFPTYTPVYTPVSSTDFVTGVDGKARLSYVPPTAGTYMLDVSGDGAHTQTLVWVGGAGSAAWPELPDQRLELTADRNAYKVGETANVFIPNPFATNALALVTVERGLVSKAEVLTLTGSGNEYSLELTEADAPNIYMSVTVLGQGNDFRYGLVNLPVAPDEKALNVDVVSDSSEAGPREEVTLNVQVTDNQGQPVQGEFSLSVVDLATLALADPNAEEILPFFYKEQPLGIETGLSVAAYTGRNATEAGGGGGGGGEAPVFVREEFPDTAYWNPSLITNAEGLGQATFTLPDSLTTWQVDVRGLTTDTKVGEAETQIVTTKSLLIRPVTPRFLVSGDHVLMAAIVNNNTANELAAHVSLESEGFVLDEADHATQQVSVPANGRARVEWWGTAGVAEAADLVFSVKTTGSISLEDSARPIWGALPVMQYTAPQAFVTGGVLRDGVSRQEIISLPRTFTPSGGGLEVELSPSLAGSLLSALEATDPPDYAMSAEATLSYLLPNLEVYRALNSAGLSDQELTERVTANVATSISRLLSLQNEDGGWNWWGRSFFLDDGTQSNASDPYISAYIFFGLVRAREIGMRVDDNALQRAGTYLSSLKPEITNDTAGTNLDEMAFVQFALSQANSFDEAIVGNLYNVRDRLSPSSQALLAYVIHKINPADERVRDLISNLESSAVLTASGAHWETPKENIFTTGSPLYTTSVVTYVLAQLDPANTVVFNAVRYLAAHRNTRGVWSIGHENAWAMMALNEAMLGFGDLNADFAFHATLNGGPLASGDVSGNQVLAPVQAEVPLEFLSPTSPNLLTVQREEGLGRLYYRAVLNVHRPVEDVKPIDAGMQVERIYCESTLNSESTKSCQPISTVELGSDKPVTARLTLVLPHDSYYVMVEDFIPAGAEILNRSLKTSQQGIESTDVEVQFDDSDPFAQGWGWWLFHEPQIRDDGILFSADFLPAGTYVLTYTLIPLQTGEYRVLPAHAWESFFPEVQGTSAGTVFEIKP